MNAPRVRHRTVLVMSPTKPATSAAPRGASKKAAAVAVVGLHDIKPTSPVVTLDRTALAAAPGPFPLRDVCVVTGLSPAFVKKVCSVKCITGADVLELLDQDSYHETLVPRSQTLHYLTRPATPAPTLTMSAGSPFDLHKGSALDLIRSIVPGSIQSVVTSPPYWGVRVYDQSFAADWADGSHVPYGHEQTPDAYIRHTTEILVALYDTLAPDGSIWWNVMDTYNTRAPIRSNGVEALRAMEGKDSKAWGDHTYRRYSAGHAYILDGEQCLIPQRVAEHASRVGFNVKSIITWAKTNTVPDPQTSRVSRSVEYIIHLSKGRTPKFNKGAYRTTEQKLGGRDPAREVDKATDVWMISPSAGRDGHGAQFPTAIPGRCIALSTDPGDLVLDPFMGAGTTGVAALLLGRRALGFDVADEYLSLARSRMHDAWESQ